MPTLADLAYGEHLRRSEGLQRTSEYNVLDRIRKDAIEKARREKERLKKEREQAGIGGGIMGAIGGGITGFMTTGNPLGAVAGAVSGGLKGYSSATETGQPLTGALSGGLQGFETGMALEKHGAEIEKLTAETLKSKATEAGYSVLSDIQKKALGLDPKSAYQISSKGQISKIGGEGVTVNIGDKGKTGTIPPGFALRTTDQDTYEMYEIPGGPASQKTKEDILKKKKKEDIEEFKTDIVINNIDRVKNKIKEAPWFSPITGAVASKFMPSFRQNRVDAEELIKTIKANIGFDRLQQMRDASPTGGALGQVSERELETLESVVGSLSLSQGEDQLLKNLNDVYRQYNKIVHGDIRTPTKAGKPTKIGRYKIISVE